MKPLNLAIAFLLSIVLLSSCRASKPLSAAPIYPIKYELSMSNPSSHFFEVKMTIDLRNNVLGQEFLNVAMPTWTPGSYLIREYAKNVEGFTAMSSGKELNFKKISKNTWQIETQNKKLIEVSYTVYANELTVRTSHLDDSHGYVNGASVFMFVKQLMHEPTLIKVNPHSSFSKVSVALPEIAKNEFVVENYDLVVDSPIEIGNQDIISFDYEGVKHTIANYSTEPLQYDKNTLITDYKKIIKASHDVIGGVHPCKDYLFIVHHAPNVGGGLEHLNSTTCQTNADVYQNKDRYIGFLGLIAHEYFHLWNVKRIRPVALGPFDYENENYTNMLWVSEGFTAYYQDEIVRRAGFIDQTKYLNIIASDIIRIENSPGNKIQSASESSWDAWIKYYRPNENSYNSTISYYDKGGVIANVLNLIIIDNTKGQKSLDDVLRLLYTKYYQAENRGFTDSEFQMACEQVAGINLNTFFKECIYGTKTIQYSQYFNAVGLKANFKSNNTNPWIGAIIRNNTVIRVDKGSGAYDNGLNVGDEILSIDNKENKNIVDALKAKQIGESLSIEVLRNKVKRTFQIPIKANPSLNLELIRAENQDSDMTLKFNKYFKQ